MTTAHVSYTCCSQLVNIFSRAVSETGQLRLWQQSEFQSEYVRTPLQVPNPMDLATLLSRVDGRQIPTVKAFLDTAALIPAGEQQFWGSDPEGIREVSTPSPTPLIRDEDHASSDSGVLWPAPAHETMPSWRGCSDRGSALKPFLLCSSGLQSARYAG